MPPHVIDHKYQPKHELDSDAGFFNDTWLKCGTADFFDELFIVKRRNSSQTIQNRQSRGPFIDKIIFFNINALVYKFFLQIYTREA